MLQYTAIAIAAVFALVGFLPLAGGSVRRPLLWLSLVAGAAAGYFAREGTLVALDLISPYIDVAAGPVGAATAVLIAAAVGELLKATPALAAVSIGSADEVTGLAYGAAAGAGFGFFVTQRVLAMALGLIGSPFITPLSAGVAIFGWFFRILAHIVTTANVARAGVGGGLGGALFLAWMIQFALGMAERWPKLAGVPIVLVTAVISLGMFGYLWRTRSRAASPAAGS